MQEREDEEIIPDPDPDALCRSESDDKQDVEPLDYEPQTMMPQGHLINAPKTMKELADSSPGAFSEQFLTGPSAFLENRPNSRPVSYNAEPSSFTQRHRKRGRSTSSDYDNDSTPKTRNNRSRKSQAKSNVTPTPGGRTLRARIPKSEEKIRQEQELDLAFRRAIRE